MEDAEFRYGDKRVFVAPGRSIKDTMPDVRKKFKEQYGVDIPDNAVVRTGGYPIPDRIVVDANLWVITDD